MSMLDQLDAYESPHKLPMYPMSGANLDAHHRWYQAREYYATVGANPGEMEQEDIEEARAYWYDQMLKAVTETNPPVNRIDLNASPAVKPERADNSKPMRVWVTYVFLVSVVVSWLMAVMWVIT
jgi:hypothetical protein